MVINFPTVKNVGFSVFSFFSETCSLLQITQFLETQGFLDFLERGIGSDENNDNLLDKLQDALGRGQDPMSILPAPLSDHEIITISDQVESAAGRFPLERRLVTIINLCIYIFLLHAIHLDKDVHCLEK